MKAVVAAFNQEKALVGAFSVLTNLRMELFQALGVIDNVDDVMLLLLVIIMMSVQVYEGGWKNNLQQGRGEHSFASGHYDVAEWDQVRCGQWLDI